MQFIVAGPGAATVYIPLILANSGAVYINFLLAAEQNHQRAAKSSVPVVTYICIAFLSSSKL
jgi:hypothetical protein